jgi:hypothetical protein
MQQAWDARISLRCMNSSGNLIKLRLSLSRALNSIRKLEKALSVKSTWSKKVLSTNYTRWRQFERRGSLEPVYTDIFKLKKRYWAWLTTLASSNWGTLSKLNHISSWWWITAKAGTYLSCYKRRKSSNRR